MKIFAAIDVGSYELAMKICATAIAVRYKLHGLGDIVQTRIKSGLEIVLPKGLRTFVCDTQDGILPIQNLLNNASSAVVLTSRLVDDESLKVNFPVGIGNWSGSVMTFGSSDTCRLALIVIESKS